MAVRAQGRSLRALQAGIAVPVWFMALLSSVVYGGVDVGMMNDQDMVMRQAAYSTVAFLNVIQVVVFAFALVAYRANRDRPGFLPQPVGGR